MGSCNNKARTGSVAHELGHILGLQHTQKRPDRDNFIHVHWNRFIPTKKEQYLTSPYDYTGADGKFAKYDLESIMHYSPTQGDLHDH